MLVFFPDSVYELRDSAIPTKTINMQTKDKVGIGTSKCIVILMVLDSIVYTKVSVSSIKKYSLSPKAKENTISCTFFFRPRFSVDSSSEVSSLSSCSLQFKQLSQRI
jgi:hypothetical protein